MNQNIEICNMSLEDFISIKDTLSTDFDDFWKPSILEHEIKNPESICIVAKLDNNIIGFATLWKSVDDIHITNIVVRKNLRKKRYRLPTIGKTYNYR